MIAAASTGPSPPERCWIEALTALGWESPRSAPAAAGFVGRSGKRYTPTAVVRMLGERSTTSAALAAEAVVAALWERVGQADDPKRLTGLSAR